LTRRRLRLDGSTHGSLTSSRESLIPMSVVGEQMGEK
jgi:hypothetical protein